MWNLIIFTEIFLSIVLADPTNDHVSHENDVIQPMFIANPQDFTVQMDDDITFPCDLEHLGTQQLMFRHISKSGQAWMLYVGDMALKPKSRVTKDGDSFILSGVRRKDAGEYECRIESDDSVVQLVHTLDVQFPATVKRVSKEEQRVAKGSSVTLECSGEGNPKAAISWSKKEGLLPSGNKHEEGFRLKLEGVDRHSEGTYMCTASNGVGAPSSTTMTVQVEYPPEILTQETMLHTGEGEEIQLTCIVHGRPSPEVIWIKDGRPLSSEEYPQEHDGLNQHVITINHVQTDDFGDYTCRAHNDHGTKHITFTLTGLPKPPRMTSSPAGGEETSYTLTWEIETNTPISQYRLKYRNAQDIEANVYRGWDDRLYSPPQVNKVSSIDHNIRHMSPDIHHMSHNIHHMSHTIKGLQPATEYETTVAVENLFGWSNSSQIFRFFTRKDPTTTTTTTTTTATPLAPEPENMAPLLEEIGEGQSSSSSNRRWMTSFFLGWIIFWAVIY